MKTENAIIRLADLTSGIEFLANAARDGGAPRPKRNKLAFRLDVEKSNNKVIKGR